MRRYTHECMYTVQYTIYIYIQFGLKSVKLEKTKKKNIPKNVLAKTLCYYRPGVRVVYIYYYTHHCITTLNIGA